MILSKELDVLKQYAKGLIVEIGTWKGETAIALAQYGEVWTIDPHFEETNVHGRERPCAWSTWFDVLQNIYREMRNNNLDCGSIYPFLADSRTAEYYLGRLLSRVGRRIDLLFIDGDHSFKQVEFDLKLWLPHVNGHVALHDCRPGSGPERAGRMLGASVTQVGSLKIWRYFDEDTAR